MENIQFCPYRIQVTSDPSTIATTEFEVQTTRFDLQTAKYEDPVTFTGTAKDLELLEACKADSNPPPRLAYQIGRNLDPSTLCLYI